MSSWIKVSIQTVDYPDPDNDYNPPEPKVNKYIRIQNFLPCQVQDYSTPQPA
jgi:hypothetical protein